jgi:hypothetical protein
MRRAVEKEMAALEAMQAKRKEATPERWTKPSASRNWRHRKVKSTTWAEISAPPLPAGSSFFGTRTAPRFRPPQLRRPLSGRRQAPSAGA